MKFCSLVTLDEVMKQVIVAEPSNRVSDFLPLFTSRSLHMPKMSGIRTTLFSYLRYTIK